MNIYDNFTFDFKKHYTIQEIVKLINTKGLDNPKVYISNSEKISKAMRDRKTEFNFEKVGQELKEEFENKYIEAVIKGFAKHNCNVKLFKRVNNTDIFKLNDSLKFYISNKQLLVLSDKIETKSSTFETIEDFIKELERYAPQYLSVKLGKVSSVTGL